MAQPVPALARGNLLWRKDAADWVFGVLGIFLARALKSVAISKVDC
jgi:hypothetical protein